MKPTKHENKSPKQSNKTAKSGFRARSVHSALLLLLGVGLCVLALSYNRVASSQGSRQTASAKPVSESQTFDNFDVRIRQPKKVEQPDARTANAGSLGQLTLESAKPRAASAAQAARSAAIIQSMNAAQEQLAAQFPNSKVEFNETVHVPEIVSVQGGGALADAVKGQANDYTLRNFLTENAALYGLTQAQVGQLVKVSDYTNPAGNLSFVEFEQKVNGIRVFQGYVRGILAADGRLVRTTGLLAAGVSAKSLATTPKLDATAAVAAAAGSIKVDINADSLAVLENIDAQTQIVSQRPFDEAAKTPFVYSPLPPTP